jgi:predicted nucleic acid-binding protein
VRLLDSDVMIDMLRRYRPALDWFDQLAEAPGVPGLVVLELMDGCRNKRDMAAVQALVQGFTVYWPTPADGDRATTTYARLRLRFHIRIPDLLIAECAVGLAATLCTFNVKHMKAIPGLVTEQPYPRP